MMELKLLCVLPSIPVPTDTGGRLRTLRLLMALDAAFDVTVLTIGRTGTDPEGLRRMLRGQLVLVGRALHGPTRLAIDAAWALRGKPFSYESFASNEIVAAAQKLLGQKRFDLVHFDHIHTAQLLPIVRRLQPLAKIVIDEQNVEAKLFEQKANLSRWPMKAVLRWQAWRIDVLESQLLSSCDAVLACSSRDKEHLQRRGATHVRVVPNGVDVEEMQVAPGPERMDVVFVGSMDWWPNSDAAMRLVKEIWPLVAPAVAPSRLAIVGRNPAGGAARASQRPGGDIRNGGQREAVFGRLLGYRDAAAGRLRHPPKDPRGGCGGRSGRVHSFGGGGVALRRWGARTLRRDAARVSNRARASLE